MIIKHSNLIAQCKITHVGDQNKLNCDLITAVLINGEIELMKTMKDINIFKFRQITNEWDYIERKIKKYIFEISHESFTKDRIDIGLREISDLIETHTLYKWVVSHELIVFEKFTATNRFLTKNWSPEELSTELEELESFLAWLRLAKKHGVKWWKNTTGKNAQQRK